MIVLLIILSIAYTFLIARLILGFQKVPEFHFSEQEPQQKFSILIPFRNEEDHLPTLLHSLNAIHYNRTFFEVIFIDDDSTDASVKIIQQELSNTNVNYQIIRNQRTSNSPKKDAIEAAIKITKHEWILTTDADCILPESWLQVFNEYTTRIDSKMMVGPVSYKTNDSFIENFQLFEFLSLQGATIGGFGIGKPFLCNGANLAYKKQLFLELNGYQGNNNIASGDDIFLFEKFYKEYPEHVHFLKSRSALVRTFPLATWKDLVHQRMRWAAKSGSSKLWFGKFAGIIVFLTNLSWIMAVINLFTFRRDSLTLIALLLIKIMVDYYFLSIISKFYKNPIKIKSYIVSSLLYPFFSVFIVFKALFSKYRWKDRYFKK